MNIKKYTLLFSLFSFFCVSMAQGGNSDAEDSDSSTPTQMDASPHSFPPDQLIRIPKTSSPTYAQIKECISVYESSEVLKPDLKDKRAWQECVRTLFGKMVCFDDLKELGKLRSRISEIRKVNKGNDIVNALYKAVKRIEIEIKRLSPISCFSRNQKNIMNIVSDSFNQENPNYSYPENRDQWEQLARKLKDEWDPEGSKALSTFMAYMYDICNLLNDGPKKEIYKNLANALARIHKAQRKQKNIAPLVDKSSGDDIEIKKLSPISCFSKNQKKILNIVSDSFNQENPNYSYPENRGQWEQLARKLKDEWDPEGSKVLSTFMVCMYGICNLLNDGPKKEICKNLANVLSRIERSQRKQKKIARLVDKASGPNYVDDCVALDKTDLLPIDTSEEQSSLEDDTDDVSTKIIDDLAFVTSAVPSAASSDESSLNMPSSAAYEIRRKILEERRAKVIAIVNAYISSQERPADNKEWEKCARTLFGDLFRFDDEKEITSLRNMLFILFKSNGNIIELRLLGNAVKRIEKPLKRRNRSSSDKLTPAQRESDALPIDTSEELSSMEVAKEGVSTTIVDDRLFLTSAVPSAASADESSPNLPSSDTHKIRSKTYKQKRAEKVIAIVNAYISSQELPTDSQGRQECVRTLFGDLFRFDDKKEMACLRKLLSNHFKSNRGSIEFNSLSYAVRLLELRLKKSDRSSSGKLTPAQRESDVLPIDTSEELSSVEVTKEAVSTKIVDDLAFVTSAVPSADESSLNMPSSAAYEIERKIYNEKRAKVIAIVNAYISSQELPTDSQGRQECARTLFGDLFRFDDEKEMMCLRNMLYNLFKSNGNIIELRFLANAVRGFENRLKRQNRPISDGLTPTQREIVDYVSHSLNPKNQYDWLNLAVKVKNFWDPKGSKDINFLIEHIHKICNYLTNADEQRIYFSLSHAINFLYGPSISEAGVLDLWKNVHSESLPIFVASESRGVDGLAFAISGSRFIRTAFPVDERYLSAVKSNTCNEVSADLILGLLSNKNLGKRAQREEEDISSKRARTK